MPRIRQIKASDQWTSVPIKLPQSWIDVLKKAADRSGWTMTEQIRYTIGRVYDLIEEEKRPYFPMDDASLEESHEHTPPTKGPQHETPQEDKRESQRVATGTVRY